MYNELFSSDDSEVFVTKLTVSMNHVIVKVSATAPFKLNKRYDWHMVANGAHFMASTTGQNTNTAVIVFICTKGAVTCNDRTIIWTGNNCRTITAQQTAQTVNCSVNVDGAIITHLEGCITRVNQSLSQQIQSTVQQAAAPKRLTNSVCAKKSDDSGWFLAVIIVAVISIVASIFVTRRK